MTVYISAISPAGVKDAQHISKIRWINSADSKSSTQSMANAVAWVKRGNKFVVAGPDGPVAVQVVDAEPPYLRTVANSTETDNLLRLPKF